MKILINKQQLGAVVEKLKKKEVMVSCHSPSLQTLCRCNHSYSWSMCRQLFTVLRYSCKTHA